MLPMKGEISTDSSEAQYASTKAETKVGNPGVSESSKSEIKEADNYYLISCRWWKHWHAYVGERASSSNHSMDSVPVYGSIPSKDPSMGCSSLPSSFDKSELELNLTREMECQSCEPVNENDEYILMPEQTWIAFQKWYCAGPASGGKLNSSNGSSLTEELHPLRLHLTVHLSGSHLTVRISKRDTAGELYQRADELFNMSSEHIRIWDYSGKPTDFGDTLDAEIIEVDHDMLLHVQVDGSYPDHITNYAKENGATAQNTSAVSDPSKARFSFSSGYSGRSSILEQNDTNLFSTSLKDYYGQSGFSSDGGKVEPRGLAGLQNLGNTCFMNSSLQCLAHTPQLVEYFLQDYSREINQHNPLGMEGELAITFGELLRKLWAPGRSPVAPRAFKGKLARFAPQFSGYNQHDSQELLAFLLDGLHEDLNRVKLKPYIESKDADRRPDEEVANEYWENHKTRNNSIIVDICQGQYKSTLVCPTCSKVSITFDPFMYLSLPFSSTATRTMIVTVFESDGSELPNPYTVVVPKQGKWGDLFQAVGKACNLKDDERLLFAEIYSARLFHLLEDPSQSLRVIRDDYRVAAYRLPKISEKSPLLIFTHCRIEENMHWIYRSLQSLKLVAVFMNVICRNGIIYQELRLTRNFGVPLVTWLPSEGVSTGKDLANLFEKLISPLAHIDQSMQSFCNATEEKADEDNNKESHTYSNGSSLIADLNNGEGSKVNGSSQPLFRFCLSEEDRLMKGIPIEEDTCLPISHNSKAYYITTEWSDRALKAYDAKHLESLPEVSKPGFLMTKKMRPEAVSLYACLEAFLKEEPLGPDDMWYCPSCKEHRQASKKLDLWRLPGILVVHLKRFSYSRHFKNKLDTFIDFPIHNLDLTKYIAPSNPCGQEYVYELYAISNHYGSMGGGHYTAYCKLIDDNKWYNFDDSRVSPISEEELKTSAAYVLFYRRSSGETSAKHNEII